MSASAPLVPTYCGIVNDTSDALCLFELCLQGRLQHVPRRPHDRERPELIRSGNIFIYEEDSSGIKRWTDGITWSPSRILNNFLVYRELDQSIGPGEKKRALKKPASKRAPTSGGIVKSSPPGSATSPSSHGRLSISNHFGVDSSPNTLDPSTSSSPSSVQGPNANGEPPKDPIRDLVGSLTDSYDFRERGLVKKTISIKYQGVNHHLVSYYSIEDALEERLTSPKNDPNIRGVHVRQELIFSQAFRTGVNEYQVYGSSGRASIIGDGYMAIPHHIDAQPTSGLAPPQHQHFPQDFGTYVTHPGHDDVHGHGHTPVPMPHAPMPNYGVQMTAPAPYDAVAATPVYHPQSHPATFGSTAATALGSASFDSQSNRDYMYQEYANMHQTAPIVKYSDAAPLF